MKEILKYLYDAETTMTIYRSDGSTELFESDSVYYELRRYWDYTYVSPVETMVSFMYDWNNFVKLYSKDLERAYDALYSEYDPTANYDMLEEGSDGKKLDATTTETTPDGTTTVTTTPSGTVTQKEYANTYDETATDPATPTTKTETSYTNASTSVATTYTNASVTVENTPDNTMASKHLGDSRYHEASDHTLTRKGNIGVTTTQQMIESELELRKTELLSDFIKRFIGRHFSIWYAGC